MGLFKHLFGGRAAAPETVTAELPENGAGRDQLLAEMLAANTMTESGASVTVDTAMKNTTVFRCVSLISNTIGMLPLHLYENGEEKRKAVEHPLYRLLMYKPNDWQSAFDFKSHMQMQALVRGDAFALIVRSMGRPIRLIPLPPGSVTLRQKEDWTVEYRVQMRRGGMKVYGAHEILHLRGLSMDGKRGMSLVRQAAEAIGLALQTEKAAARLFRNGMLVGGAVKAKKQLSPAARKNLEESMAMRESAENAYRWLVLEEEMDAIPFTASSQSSQHLETRKHQVEEIARVFGAPRPLLMVDDTSWGSGIDVLGQFFVRYGLSPWFAAWEQAIFRSALTDAEREFFYAKFNEGALLRGSMKDQADFFAKALGSGGSLPWMTQDEVRSLQELGRVAPGELKAVNRKENDDEPPATA